MFAVSFAIYLLVISIISAYVSPSFGVSRPASSSSSLEAGAGGGGLFSVFSRTPTKEDRGYDPVDGEVFELGDMDDMDGSSEDSFDRELEEEEGEEGSSEDSRRKVGMVDERSDHRGIRQGKEREGGFVGVSL